MLSNIPSSEIAPIMGPEYSSADFAPVNLNKDHLAKVGVASQEDLGAYLLKTASEKAAKWLTGGYIEHRALYQSNLFLGNEEDVRDIHLGIDIWGKVNAPIYAPYDGRIHSFAYNGGELDYGYTLILEHELNESLFYSLYGHLSSSHFEKWSVGNQFKAGDEIANIGDTDENGGWIPHLHFQIILDLEGEEGDYPGVCAKKDLPHYRLNCPDPSTLIKKAS